MSMQVRVEALKQQLEQLFPGKWLSADKRTRHIETGLAAIDTGITRGIARKRITEWTGPLSSGKTTLLRNAISHWCLQGLNVAYIDSEGKLYPADWSSIGSASSPNNGLQLQKGKFWIVRPADAEAKDENVVPLVSKRNMLAQEAIWSADQFIRSNAFDVVILDLGGNELSGRKKLGMGYISAPSRIYARLQRSLDRSKAALIIVSDSEFVYEEASSSSEYRRDGIPQAAQNNNWGCHARFVFNRGLAVRCESSLKGVALISPSVRLSAWRDGLSQEVEVNLGCPVPNRLFTHSPVPDRRTSKG